MALNPVSLPDALLPWHNAGILYLVAEEPVLPSLAKPAAVSMAKAHVVEAESYVELSHGPLYGTIPTTASATNAQIRQQTFTETHSKATEAISTSESNQQIKPSPSAQQPKPIASVATPATSLPDPSTWSAQWQNLLAKTRPAPVIWSYAELGEDLRGIEKSAQSAERSLCLKEFIAELKLRKGSSSFWPMSLPQEQLEGAQNSNGLDSKIFHDGMDLLKSRVLILLGPDSLPAAGYPQFPVLAYQQHVISGRLIVVVPSFSAILSDPAKKNATQAYLHSALSHIHLG